jgi:hypothetical protein
MAMACGRQSPSPTAPGAQSGGTGDAAADGSTLKATAAVPVDPTNDKQVSDAPTLAATASTLKYAPPQGALGYRFQVFNAAGLQIQDSGLQTSPSFKVTATLAFKSRYTWRVRPELQNEAGPWSATASFISPEGGYIRGNEVFDPLYNGATVGEAIGPVTFLGAKGVRLDTVGSYIRYLIPQTITSGEFSMEVEGLRANAPGDKSKVFGMQEGTSDYITNRYRVDVQYRGTAGFPPNAITYRVIYGDGDDLSKRYEPTTEQRNSSVFALDPNTTYYWKYTWGSQQVRVTVKAGGINGATIYDLARNSTNGSYNPQPMYAFIGTPTGRSGAESATIPGAIYRNVWIGARPRP